MTRRRIALALLLAVLLGTPLLVRRAVPERAEVSQLGLASAARRTPPRAPVTAHPIPRFIATPAPAPWPLGFVPPQVSYPKEVRAEPWALAMEHALRTWMSPEVLRELALERVEILDLSCRQTTCRLEYEYPSALVDRLTKRGLPPQSPLLLIEELQGPPSPMSGGGDERTVVRGGEPYQRISIFLGFNEAAGDPAQHAPWARSRIPQMQRHIERLRDVWQAKLARKRRPLGPDAG